MERAASLGLPAIGITDRNSLAGVVRAHVAAKEAGIRLLVGARLDFEDGLSLLCYPRNHEAYGRLCRLLTLGQRRANKGECRIYLEDFWIHAEGQVLIVLPPPGLRAEIFAMHLATLRSRLSGPLYLAAQMLYRGDDRARIARLARLAGHHGIPLVATNDVLYHLPERRPLQDVLTAIREHTTVQSAGYLLEANAERHLKSPAEMMRLFAGYEALTARTIEIAQAVRFRLDELTYEYPDEPVPAGKTPQQHLEDLTWEGAARHFPDGVSEALRSTLEHELGLIAQLDYACYFLTVYDIVQFAKQQGILCQGRGSAANSAVCYCLGITAVNPTEIDLLFERFISPERREPPDIDIDFEHERREEVIQYIYERYGRDRAALTATVITYRARSAAREAGKAMGLSEDAAAALADSLRKEGGFSEQRAREAGFNPADPVLRMTLGLASELMGFPRHLSQHVGGFVLSRGPLCNMVPIGNAAMRDRTFVEWDKDDLEALGLMKVDVLALGMLTCIRKAFELLKRHRGIDLTLADVPREEAAVYDMLCRADSIGVFQIESRAQMNMLPRLKPRCFYDLVIEVAIVRPGPIQGDMVHPYLRRRDGLEELNYPEPAPDHGPPDELKKVLEKTLGVPLFQEQAMRIAITAAKFTPDEANALRRSMATFRKRGTLRLLREKMVGRMVRRGYDPELAARCFRQIEGFGEYGFPESHAASFAHLAYVSSWLKCFHPETFACALLNSQPMGFYAAAQIVRDVRDHGFAVRSVDVNMSHWDNTLEPDSDGSLVLRLGMRQIGGLREEDARRVVEERDQPYVSVADVRRRTGIPTHTLERLAEADAFRSTGSDRRQALWDTLDDTPRLPLFDAHPTPEPSPRVSLPAMPPGEHVLSDYRVLRLSLKAHPLAFLREKLARAHALPAAEICHDVPDGQTAIAGGIVLARQRPGSAKGVIFMTLEDETGVVNVVIWPKTTKKFRRIVMTSRLAMVKGRVQKTGQVVHLVADRLEDITPWLSLLSESGRSPSGQANRAPRNASVPIARHPRNQRILPKSRDFH